MKNTIKLFNCLEVKNKNKKQDSELMKETIKRGFIFDEVVISSYSKQQLLDIIKEIGLTGEQMNSSFHKSWVKIKDASIEQLVIEQLIHYFTTYGFESMGLSSNAYIPAEKLEIPELKENINLKVIKGLTKEEIKKEFFKLTNIALKEETIKLMLETAIDLELSVDEIDKINNKELKISLYEYLNKVPNNPVEILRLAVYRATETTLLIKSNSLINQIKEKQNINVVKLFQGNEKKLAEIFYRFKPLFLAFKTNKKLKSTINSIRKLAVKYHKPMPEDYLNTITSRDSVDLIKLEEELEKVNIFRKIRLAYALNFRLNNPNSIIYRIRNGKSYATEFNGNTKIEVYDTVIKSIVNSLNVKGKKIYIPEYIDYALPATEKQFTGNIPIGTSINVSDDMIFGIYWDNVKYNRIDLDLSLIDNNGCKFGWDGSYRDENRNILFSGDMTDATNGATELFYIKKAIDKNGILVVNYYNYSDVDVPFNIIIAKEKPSDFGSNYVVNPNNILALSEAVINQKQKVLGLVKNNKFYFAETNIGNSISSDSYVGKYVRDYFINYYENAISLNEVLIKAGALITNKDNCDIDLSIENINKNTIIDLIS